MKDQVTTIEQSRRLLELGVSAEKASMVRIFEDNEAEERMRRKAISAFDDMWFSNGEDGEFEPDYEYHRKNFIQKLTEQ